MRAWSSSYATGQASSTIVTEHGNAASCDTGDVVAFVAATEHDGTVENRVICLAFAGQDVAPHVLPDDMEVSTPGGSGSEKPVPISEFQLTGPRANVQAFLCCGPGGVTVNIRNVHAPSGRPKLADGQRTRLIRNLLQSNFMLIPGNTIGRARFLIGGDMNTIQ